MSSIEGKKIIVTGGSQGIGEGLVHGFVGRGSIVASMARRREQGEKVVSEANEKGPGKARFYKCDISNRSEVDSAFDAAVKDMGGLDALVQVAGVQLNKPAAELTDENYDWMFRNTVLGTMLTNQAAYKVMSTTHAGVIINFSSESGLTGEIGNSLYGAAKGAVMTWTRTLAYEWGPQGIRMYHTMPIMKSPVYNDYLKSMAPADLEQWKKVLKEKIPLTADFGESEVDMAPVLACMISDDFHYVTGQGIAVDGGWAQLR